MISGLRPRGYCAKILFQLGDLKMKNSEREKFRIDFSQAFLNDIHYRLFNWGHDPRNHIGKNCGYNFPRALQMFHDGALRG